jgi:ribonuclease HI
LTEDRVTIYTDGACDPNPGPGGWAAILRTSRHEKVISGGNSQTTNNRMELQAALSALRALKRPCTVILHTDSEYLRRGITEWLVAWQKNGWHTSDRRAVRNQDLWQALASEMSKHKVQWRWVRGHAGDELNERVDRLARAAIPRPETRRQQTDAASTELHLYTRASSLGKSGPGGWAAVLRWNDQLQSRSGHSAKATANEMELEAAIQGLTSLTTPGKVNIHTVSQYLFLGITRWVAGWEAHGWVTKEGRPVRNKDRWRILQRLDGIRDVEWHLLSSGDRPSESEQAAVLASQAARAAEEEIQTEGL